jgi:hypothetical protein
VSETKGSTSVGTGTAEIPVVRPGATAPAPEPAVQAPAQPPAQPPAPPAAADLPPGAQGTAPVTVRPRPRTPRRSPLTVMGPWAPVAGGLLGILLGGVAAAVLAGAVETFDERLAVVFAVVGLGLLGAAVTLLADEVRIVRQRTREAPVRPQWVESTADLVNGLTPARLLLLVSAFVLFLAAYVGRG